MRARRSGRTGFFEHAPDAGRALNSPVSHRLIPGRSRIRRLRFDNCLKNSMARGRTRIGQCFERSARFQNQGSAGKDPGRCLNSGIHAQQPDEHYRTFVASPRTRSIARAACTAITEKTFRSSTVNIPRCDKLST
jgi:hypothetical protein